jgi:hypothetical protein
MKAHCMPYNFLPVVVIQIENHDDTNANLNKACPLRFLKQNFKKIYIGMTDSRALRTKFQKEHAICCNKAY